MVPRDKLFVHGKAGIIETNVEKTCFLGSINETKNAFPKNYEILWEDTSDEGVFWVEEKFDALWREAYPLPDAIIEEIGRISQRVEVSFKDIPPNEMPAAALAEAPIYRNGEILMPWQRSFVTTFMEHRELYGKSRLLLAKIHIRKSLVIFYIRLW